PVPELARTDQVTSDGPPMTVDEFAEAQRLYYGHCTGCHGVLREGTAGNPLTPDVMRARGTLYLQTVIHYGASSGMPNWGTNDVLTAREMDLLARYLQHPVPQAPDMDLATIRDGWRQLRAPAQRPTEPPEDFDPDHLFAVTLHDVGQVMLIDGRTRGIITTIDVGRSPHEISASASGRYLYVICRDGTLGLIDLWLSPPERVATVRVGYEARAAAASAYPGFADRYVLAGAFWPPQLVLLDGRTLEPLRLVPTRSYPRAGAPGPQRYHPEPRATDIIGSRAHPEFIASIKETGQFLRVPFATDDRDAAASGRDRRTETERTPANRINTVRELRAGALTLDGRHLLTPADTNAVSVLDTDAGAVVAEIPARVFGGSTGSSYDHSRFGAVWVTATMVNAELLAIGTDPDRHPETAWQVVERVPTPAAGTLFLATHPASPHLWLDQPLASEPSLSGSLSVFARNNLTAGATIVPVAAWSGLADGPRRAVQPVFDVTGREVWTLVWNPQNKPAAIVIIDDRTRAHRATITDPRLITPTRIYRVGDLQNRTRGPLPAGAALYQTHCANCHGVYGGGDGPLAGALANPLRDLRDLSTRNDGVFPRDFVTDIIDGRASRAA
ncbi:MAG: cytochrome D1 domain-containing protein, partial [Gammaproteobacteria bacterium]